MTNEERAILLAAEANECCHRSDGFEDQIRVYAQLMIEQAVAEEREACARAATRRADEYQAAEIDAAVDACLEVAAEIRARASDADAEAVDDGPAVDVQ